MESPLKAVLEVGLLFAQDGTMAAEMIATAHEQVRAGKRSTAC
jgi:hypothetical protein